MIPHMTPHDLGVLVCTSARVRAFVGGKRITTLQQKYFYDVMFGRALTANIGTAIYSMPVEKLDLDIATLPALASDLDRALSEYIRANRELRCIRIYASYHARTPHSLCGIATAAASHTLLESLTLPGHRVGIDGLLALVRGLAAANSALTSLDLGDIGLHSGATAATDEAFEALVHGLAASKTLRSLKLELGNHKANHGQPCLSLSPALKALFRGVLEPHQEGLTNLFVRRAKGRLALTGRVVDGSPVHLLYAVPGDSDSDSDASSTNMYRAFGATWRV